MRKIGMNKKAQLDYPIVTFFIIVFGIMLIAPIVLKIFNEVNTNVGNSLGNTTGGAIAKANFEKVMVTAVTFWDKVIIFAFILSLILLFISAFLIDTNPFWVILYVILNFMLILFAPDIVDSLRNIYDSPTFALESTQLVFMNWLLNNFGVILVGVMVLAGIVIYGKMWLFAGNGGVRK